MKVTFKIDQPVTARHGNPTGPGVLQPVKVFAPTQVQSPQTADKPHLDELVEVPDMEVQPVQENATQAEIRPFVVLSTGLVLRYDKELACYIPAGKEDLLEYQGDADFQELDPEAAKRKREADIEAMTDALELDRIKAREAAQKEIQGYLKAMRFIAFLAASAIVCVLAYSMCRVIFLHFLPAVAAGATVAGEKVGMVVAWLAGAAVIGFAALWALSGLFSSVKTSEPDSVQAAEATNNITIIQNLASSKAQNIVQP